jgi:hypothetical protein
MRAWPLFSKITPALQFSRTVLAMRVLLKRPHKSPASNNTLPAPSIENLRDFHIARLNLVEAVLGSIRARSRDATSEG